MNFLQKVIMGIAIGAADLVPGVSGGTLAFAFGIWEKILYTISEFARALLHLLRFNPRSTWQILRDTEWLLVIPVGLGIVTSLLIGASLVGHLYDNYPEYLRGCFLGIVLGTLPGAINHVSRWSRWHVLLVVFGASISFLLAGLPERAVQDPSLILIFLVAAFTICSTMLPGISGSFLLLIFGFYEIFIDAIRNRDIVIWAAFAGGSLVGMLTFASLIRQILRTHREVVLSVLLGLMLGGLRVLWPWLDDDRVLLKPTNMESLLLALGTILFGISAGYLLVLVTREKTAN